MSLKVTTTYEPPALSWYLKNHFQELGLKPDQTRYVPAEDNQGFQRLFASGNNLTVRIGSKPETTPALIARALEAFQAYLDKEWPSETPSYVVITYLPIID